MNSPELKVAIFCPNRGKMGASRTVPRMARGLAAEGCRVDLLKTRDEWQDVTPTSYECGGSVQIVDLRSRCLATWIPDISRVSPMANYRVWATAVAISMLPSLVGYLRRERPDVLIARMLTVPAMLGLGLSRGQTKLVVNMSGMPMGSRFRRTLWPLIYDRAHGYVAPTRGVAEQTSELSRVSLQRFRVIHNPVLDESTYHSAQEPPNHDWLRSKTCPVVLGVGRLTKQKDFPTLVRAFAEARRSIPCRLIIIGGGDTEDLSRLRRLAEELGISQDVSLPGYESNPYAFIKSSDVYVMSSLWEGPGHALIEAQALGTPCVSTDCPDGPRDTLMDGKSGLLVPIGDHTAMAKAIVHALSDKEATERRVQVGLENRYRFEVSGVSQAWLDYLRGLVAVPPASSDVSAR